MNPDKDICNTHEFDGPFFSVVIPSYRSQQILTELHKRISAVMERFGKPFEMIFVEDCGPDHSWKVLKDIAAKDPRVTVLQMMRNSGQGNATLAGFGHAKGRLIITLDDDLQHPPEELPGMINELMENEDLDVVIGAPSRKNHNMIRRFGSNFINRINSIFLEKELDLRLTGFRIMRRSVADALLKMRVPYPALGPMILSVTRRVKNISVRHDPRKEGKSGYTWHRIVKQTLSNFIGYSMLPLRVLALIGVAGIVISILLAGYFLCRYFFIGIGVPGWTTLLLILLGTSGFNFFAFAIIGEYLLRITQISTQTAQYVVRDIYNYHIIRQFHINSTQYEDQDYVER